MSKKKKMSAAEYRAMSAKRQAPDELFEVETPSGMTWTLRLPKVENFIVSGTLPLALVEKMESARQKGLSNEDSFKALSTKEQIKAIEFSTKMLRYVCVDPKIVDDPQNDNEISPDEILMEDFNFILEWANQSGGSAADGLENFPAK